MELMQLKYFCEVAESQHVTRSAEKLHIAQPALSQAIHRLENELGVKLFVMRGRNIVLTEYGRYLEKKVKPLLATINELPGELRRMASVERTTIRVNVMAASAIITSAVIEYQKQHPVQFQLVQNHEMELCDINLFTKLFYQAEDEESEYVFTEPVLLAVPDSEKFRGKEEISLEEVREEGFVCLAGTKEFRSICDKFCAKEGFIPRVVFESDSPSTVQNLVASGCGVGFWPKYSWGSFHNTHSARLLSIKKPLCMRDLVLSYNCNKTDNSEVECFFHFLVDYFERLKEE